MMIFRSMLSAFLMYSRIPVPMVEWKEENRRYSLCFFPLVGVIIGGIFVLWQYLCGIADISRFLESVVSVLIPVVVTGGIHLDGFCDVNDAKSSFGDRDKKLGIMSDSHIGAFAVIYLCSYFLLQLALMYELSGSGTVIVACGYVLSRTLSAFSAVTFRGAKKDGTLQSFAMPAHRMVTIFVLVMLFIGTFVFMAVCNLVLGIFAVCGALVALVYYRLSSYKNFGGITGDTAGWFLQVCEIVILAFVVVGEKFLEVIS